MHQTHEQAEEHQLSRHPATQIIHVPHPEDLSWGCRYNFIQHTFYTAENCLQKIISAFVLVGKERGSGLSPSATKQKAPILSTLVLQRHIQSHVCSLDLPRPCLLPAGDATTRLFSWWDALGGAACEQQAQRDEPAEACTEQVIISVLCNYSWEGVNLWCTNLPTVYCRQGNKTDS